MAQQAFYTKINAGAGVQFSGGTIAQATGVLHTNNVLYLRGGSSGLFLQNSDGSDGIFVANDHVQITTAGAERLRVTSAGNVGIGDASPTNLSANTFSLSVNSSRNDLTGALVSKANGNPKLTQYWDSAGYNYVLTASAGDFKWFFGGSEKMRLTADGELGIGTTSPTGVLDVLSTDAQRYARFRAPNGEERFEFHIGSTGNGARLSMYDHDGTTEGVRLSSTGNSYLNNNSQLGIGTNSPLTKLQITAANASSPTANIFLDIDGSNTPGMGGQILFGTSTSATLTNYIARIQGVRSALDNGSSDIHFQTTHVATATGPTTKMTIKSDGKVNLSAYGSGSFTGTAAYNLQVDSSGNIIETAAGGSGTVTGSGTATYLPIWTGGSALGNSIVSSSGGDITINGSDNDPRVYINPLGGDIGDSALIQFNSRGHVGYTGGLIELGDNGQSKDVRLRVNTADLIFQTSNTTRMTVKSTGLVGIGTSSPSTKFHVYNGEATIASSTDGVKLSYSGGNSSGVIDTAFSDNALEFRTNGSSKMFITNAGLVGIGTTSPSSKLHIESTGEALRFTRSGQETYRIIHGTSGLYFTEPDAGDLMFGVTQNSDFDIFDTSGNVMFRADGSEGRVGIGNTSPQYTLDVAGVIKGTSSIRVDAGSPYFGLYVSGTEKAYLQWVSTSDLLRLQSDGAIDYRSGGLQKWTISGSEKMTLNADGELGINQSNPRAKLEIYNTAVTSDADYSATETLSGQDSIVLYSTGTAENTYGSITWATGDRRRAMITAVAESSDSDYQGIAFYTQGTDGSGDFYESMRIKHSGQISFYDYRGTSNTGTPTYLLGTDANGLMVKTNSSSHLPGGPYLPLAGGTMSGNITISNAAPALNLTDTDNSSNIALSSVGGALIVNSTSDQVYQIGGTEYFRIAASGATFAGSLTIPNYLIHDGDSDTQFGFSGANTFIVHTGGSDRFSISGDVGVVGSTDFFIPQGRKLLLDGAGGHTYIEEESDSNLKFYVGGAEQVNITNSGVHFTQTLNMPSYIYHVNDGNTYFGFNTADSIQLVTGGGQRLLANNNGIKIGGGATVTTILDEDTMSSDSATALATQQSIKAYVDTSITGSTTFRGTWDPDVSLNSGYGNPNLNTVTKQDGYYYICSANGAATPNGTGTEPDSWHTGDWVVYNSNLTGGAAWQKIDNTSVISGAGTGQKVVKWDGSGTSETIADGPITFSSDDSTFAGDITMTSASSPTLTITDTSQTTTLKAFAQDSNAHIGTFSSHPFIISSNGGTALTIDTSQDALFSSDVAVTAKLAVGTTSVHGSYDLYNQGTFYSNGAATINANLTVDAGSISITADGSNAATLTESGGGDFTIAAVDDILLDSAGEVILDSATAEIHLKVSGGIFGKFFRSGGNFYINSPAENADIYFSGNDDGSAVNALRLDMSDSGWAHFNTGIAVGNAASTSTFAGNVNIAVGKKLYFGGGSHTYIGEDVDDRLRFFVGGAEFLRFTEDTADTIFICQNAKPLSDSAIDLGSTSLRYANIWVDNINGGTPTTGGPYLPLTGGTMTGSLIIDGEGSSSDVLKLKGSARIQLENANATDSFYISNTGGNAASVLDLGGSLSLIENGNATFTGDVTINGSHLVLANGTTEAQATDYLYIGGDGLASADAAIYIGNGGSGDNVGWRLYYEGSGSGNDNKFIIKSENTGSPVDALAFTQDGNAAFAGTLQWGGGKGLLTYGSDRAILRADQIIEFQTNATSSPTAALTLDTNQNATFAGDVTVGDELTITTINNATADPDKFLCASGANKVGYRTGAQVLSDIGAAPATGGAYLPLAGGTMTGTTKHGDDVVSYWGTGDDLEIYHNSSGDSVIQNHVGDLLFLQKADAKDITFKSDNGLGGLTEYFRIDGSGEYLLVSADLGMYFNDGIAARFGNSGDLHLSHSGTESVIANEVGNLYISQRANNSNIIFESDDSTGGLATYFQVDGANHRVKFSKDSVHTDNVKALFGDSLDVQIYHNSADSYIENYTGNFTIRQRQDTGDISFESDDGSGGTTQYFRIDGGLESLVASKDLLMAIDGDGGKLKFGASQDLQIYHQGANSFIDEVGTGNLYIRAATNMFFQTYGSGERWITLTENAGVELFHNDLPALQTNNDGIAVTGSIILNGAGVGNCGERYIRYNCPDDSVYNVIGITTGGVDIPGTLGVSGIVTLNNNLRLQDSDKIQIGNSQDLEIYHSSGRSYIDNDTGHLYIRNNVDNDDGSNIYIQAKSGENSIICNDDSSVTLYYNNSVKFYTHGSGVGAAGYYGFGSAGTSTGSTYYFRYGSQTAGATQGLIITTSDTGGSYFDGVAQFRNTNTGQGANMFQMINYGSLYGRYMNFYRGSTSNIIGYIGYNATNTAVTYSTSSSDIRLKKNIVDWSEDVLPKFLALTPKKFDFKAAIGDKGAAKVKGFIAQYETENFPEVYQLNGEGQDARYGFHPMEMVPYLMKAVKELAQKNEDLERRLAALEK